MKKIISLLLVSISLIGQTTKRSPETRKGFANVFYDPRYTLFLMGNTKSSFLQTRIKAHKNLSERVKILLA